ncbi:Nodule Cysteine-Rich (NCR) secreted peptide [Medicago truncatula]|uniref:Nodule Cysteine-Rich (NCR) secreted peptide n=1 Tax=Medicago truncatula TaxID=3880 RepID=A0A072U3B2_MEDTR|nr:Nodule Cysteine-Rich (NCR) secreted peptide [Medicago truncatula]
MAENLKFVYLLILFISIFLVIIVSHSITPWLKKICVTDKDCPKVAKINIRCRRGQCVQVF